MSHQGGLKPSVSHNILSEKRDKGLGMGIFRLLNKRQTTNNIQQTTYNGHSTMKITKDEVLYVADLARLDLDDASIDKFAGQIGDVLEYVAKLNEVDTEGLQPTSHAISLTNAFREDEQRPPLDREQALANAPEKEDGNFVVPKIVG
jgi:aspartyl-tRNA(Asn)/glutamyl-tRNA(Gln) amidotransferase subunit C